tara:strand:+ start:2058 stop:2228 length:171 start_codon:yes stop_codon:yes gene_type:complete
MLIIIHTATTATNLFVDLQYRSPSRGYLMFVTLPLIINKYEMARSISFSAFFENIF